MLVCFLMNPVQNPIPIEFILQNNFTEWLSQQNPFVKNWLQATQFRGEAGSSRLIPDESGKLSKVLFCISDMKNFWGAGSLPLTLPEGEYTFQLPTNHYSNFAIAWGLGAYQFTRYKKPAREPARLILTDNQKNIENSVSAIYWVRDLINTPTEDMGPTELADQAVQLSKQYNASLEQVIGTDLLKDNYASIYTVGRASDDAPRLLDLRWGDSQHPRITLVGKGVCFDSGGLDLKPSSYMLLMKKDMAGAAHVLGLAKMIMEAQIPVYLRVLIPVVENVISGNAYRPGDIITSRKGITIEIGNTDAEGRVILADALTEAVSEKPELLIDITTLTGAARVALGTELPAVFSNNDALVDEVIRHANDMLDPIWRLPLFTLYRDALNSPIADINNNTTDSYGGAITAALFLKEFVPDEIPWLHFDLMAWNLKSRPGRPQGAEAMALRALFSYISNKFAG